MTESIELKVSPIPNTEVGRGIARVNAKVAAKQGWKPGDIIEIIGKRKTFGKVWPTQNMAEDAIKIDSSIRSGASASIDDTVSVRKVVLKEAEYVEIAPTVDLPFTGFEQYLIDVLTYRPITKGDRIPINLMGNRIDFIITKVKPEYADAVVLTESTEVVLADKVAQAPDKGKTISYEDIGGLGKEIQRIREIVELPMKRPELFERLGVEASKGILLTGPPGCGKTLLARAVASETNSHFISVNGPEVVSGVYGGSEGNIRKIFEEAEQNAPSIIFIDEIDSIAPKREEVTGEVEKRMVAELLSRMDGLKGRGKVVVLAATNLPDSLDPALRRPGRFDREIEIGVPDAKGRFEILQIHTRGMPLDKTVSLQKIADSTHGFVGADLESLAKEAAMSALRRVLPSIDINKKLPAEKLKEISVTMNDFQSAMREVEPSAMREVLIERPNVHWDDIGGLEGVKRDLREAIEWPLKYKKTLERAKLQDVKGILLAGPPGVGNTLLAKAVATESEANFISVKGAELLNKYVGESQNNVRKIFKKARQVSPAIIFFDELESLAPVRDNSDETHVTTDVVAQLLTEMDGLEELRGVLVLAATNRQDIIDPALLRQGRFNSIITVGMPDIKAREQIAAIHLKGKPTAVTPKWVAEKTEGFSGADIAGLVDRATRRATRLYLEKHPDEKDLETLVVTESDFEAELSPNGEPDRRGTKQPYLG